MTALLIKVELEAKMVHLYNLRFLHNSIQGLMTHYFLKIYFQFAFVFTEKKKKTTTKYLNNNILIKCVVTVHLCIKTQ